MACAGLRSHNLYSVLDTVDPSMPNESAQAFPQCIPFKKGALADSSLVAGKPQGNIAQHYNQQRPYNSVPRHNGNYKPRFPQTQGRNTVIRRDHPPPHHPTPVPPRFQNQLAGSYGAPQGFCNPPPVCAVLDPCCGTPLRSLPGPCSGVIDLCPTANPMRTEILNAQLRQQILVPLQKQASAACLGAPASMPQPICTPLPSEKDIPQPVPIQSRPKSTGQASTACLGVSPPMPQRICTPIPSKKDTPQPVPIPSRPKSTAEQDNRMSMSSTPTQRTVAREQSPPTPAVVPRTPISSNATIDLPEKINVNLQPPPGLPRPTNHRMKHDNNRSRAKTKPVNGQRHLKPVENDSNFERYNGPVAASRVISPPPPGATPNVVKLPASKDTQPIPRSPTTTASSLSEDLSGSSSVLFSDTTFTSVDSNVSNVSNKVPQRKWSPHVCLRWMKRYPCYLDPCPYRHPPRSDEPAGAATQPTQSPSVPPHVSVIVKTSVHVHDQNNNNLIPRKQDPPSESAEPPQKPEPLYATTISDHIKVQFDQGFEVRDVVTGFESRWVHLGNISSTVTSAALNELLAPYKVDNINLPESLGKSVTVKVQFASSADAIKAVTDINGIEFARRTISAKLAINNSVHGGMVLTDTDTQLIWECPFRVGYVGYDTLKEAKAAIDSLNGFPMEYLVVSAQLYEGLPCVGAYNVIFKQLPASVTEGSLRKFANSKSVMLGRPNYQSLDSAVKSIRSRLEEYGTVTSFDILPPPYRDGMVKAWARFTSPTEARAAQDDLDRRRPKATGLTTIACRHVVSLSHTLNAESYRKMREDIGWMRWSWQRRYGPGVAIREKIKENADDDSPVYLRLSTERPELLSTLKYEFEQLLHGETLTFDKKPLWDDFLISEAGRTYIAQLKAQYPGVQIQVQARRRVISSWGPIVMRHRARQDIVRKVMELKAQQFWKIPLTGKLLGVFLSAELSTLQGLLGAENCIMDFGERALVVRGNELAFRTACQAVQDAQSRQGDEVSTSDVICPVCFGEAVVPVPLACGHQWCRTCLTGYLTSAVENRTFPLRCLGNDAACTRLIPLGLSRKLLSADDFNAVIEAAFWVYVHSRPEEFYHCPTPDCAQVYRSAPPNAVLQCPSCLIRICPSCRIEYHDGMTCEERDVADDKLFKEWTSHNDVKSCPGCKAPIERSEGCNHMTCTRCQTHICWECLATFPRGQGIYDHMRTQHGSIGL